jgi:RNA polymerase sigma-70 factor (ECF subfamily)
VQSSGIPLLNEQLKVQLKEQQAALDSPLGSIPRAEGGSPEEREEIVLRQSDGVLADGAVASRADDGELVRRVLAGDLGAFAPLVEAYEPTVYALSRSLLGGRTAEAEDISQETFLRAYRRLGELQDPSRFAPWVFQIARSLCRESRRKLATERRALQGYSAVERQISVPNAEPDALERALCELPGDERLALELKYLEGLSYAEIGRRLGLSFSRVDHLIRQARARLGRRVEVHRRRNERSL